MSELLITLRMCDEELLEPVEGALRLMKEAADEIERLQVVVDAARNLFTKNAWMERERLLADLRDAIRALDGEL